MARNKLTAGRIRDFECETAKAQSFLWDSDVPGLGVRATPNAKAYVFQGRINGGALRVTVGDVRAWGIDAAREEARRLQRLIDTGIDPRHEKIERAAIVEAKRHQARRQNVTVGEAWAAYLEQRPKCLPKFGERHLRNHINMAKPGGEPRTRGRRKGEPATTMPGPLFPLLAIRLSDLDSDAVREWLEPLAARTPTQAAQTFRALRAFITWCGNHKEYADQTHKDACNKGLARKTLPKARAKDDCLEREQLAAWFNSVRQIRNPVISAFLQSLLITGARREELSGLTWADIDFQWHSITIHDKVEGQRTIPLTPYVSALLSHLPRRSEWIFSSPTAASGRLQEPRIQHVKALAAAGLPHVSLHGLRRSFGTLSEWVEAPVGIVAQIMGHKPSALAEKHYRKRPLDLLRMWHAKIEVWMLEQAGLEQPKEGEGLRLVKST